MGAGLWWLLLGGVRRGSVPGRVGGGGLVGGFVGLGGWRGRSGRRMMMGLRWVVVGWGCWGCCLGSGEGLRDGGVDFLIG